MQLYLGVIPQQPPGAIQIQFNYFMHFYVTNVSISLSISYSYHKITTKYGILRLRHFQRYVFCQYYNKFWFYKTEIHLEYDTSH